MYDIKEPWELEPKQKCYTLEDYEGATPRWCPGCGDHAALSALQRLARDEQLPPEKTVVVSGIGCSSRFPHYMKTFGFHGLHGRPLPIASGIVSRRPDLSVFVVTGDGDCCAIGTAHWIHAIRYNMNMTVMLLDNNIYGLTKMQSSPTTPKEIASNTHPQGVTLSPLNPLLITLSITNASFVAQTVDWNPPHMYATLRAAHRHQGLSFIRILQRCPHYMDEEASCLHQDPGRVLLLNHPDGIEVPDIVSRSIENHAEHDPSDINAAREIASRADVFPIGLFYRNELAERYDLATRVGLDMDSQTKINAVRDELQRFVI